MKIPRFVLASTCIGILLVAGMLLSDGPADGQAPLVLRAQAIELVDGRDRVRAQLNVSPDGEVVFRLRDENGNIRTKLGADERGSGLLLLDNRTQPGVHVLATRARTALTLQRGERRRKLRP